MRDAQRPSADLAPRRITHDATACRVRDDLGAQTDAEHRLPGADRVADEGFFQSQPGVVLLVMHGHGAAHDHERRDAFRFRERLARPEVHLRKGVASSARPVRDASGPFEINVRKEDDFCHRVHGVRNRPFRQVA